ncbi:helix-turn-helix domain-containing protein [Aquipuribacter hungaricus]|uniref:Helix-turn-helix domain-containing protein n=1 Tax=Aquipuribacter hungaricus TaxID=545624 RepID=A0ABV7WI47_9MICO
MTARPVDAPRPTPPLRVLLGHVLRRHRTGQRRSLADVAHEAQVSTQYLSEVERGRKEASSEVLAAVCRALRLDLVDLLAEVRDDVLDLRSTVAAPSTRVVALQQRRTAAQPRPGTVLRAA